MPPNSFEHFKICASRVIESGSPILRHQTFGTRQFLSNLSDIVSRISFIIIRFVFILNSLLSYEHRAAADKFHRHDWSTSNSNSTRVVSWFIVEMHLAPYFNVFISPNCFVISSVFVRSIACLKPFTISTNFVEWSASCSTVTKW